MISHFNTFHRNLRILRVLMFVLLVILFGIGLSFIFFFAEGVIIIVSIVSLILIFFLALMFLGYDTMRDQQETTNNLLLESKRLFIRYVSHEIRSPLNTVHLGLRLLLQEMQVLVASPAGSEMDPDLKSKFDDWVTLIDDVEDSTDRGL
jgi:signal transduction histidine kinase